MALSGNGSVGNFAGGYGFDVYLTWTATQSIGENYSNVTARLFVRSKSGSSYFSSNSTMNININGSNGAVTKSVNVPGGQTVEVYSRTVRVGHDSSGGKYFTINAAFSANINGWSASSSGGWDLTAIPRAYSFIIASDTVDMDSNSVFFINDNGTNFTAKVFIDFGSKRIVMNANAAKGTNVSYTPKSSDFADQIPNAVIGVGNIVLETWNGTTKVGQVAQKLYLRLPTTAAYQPKINSVSHAEQNSAVSSAMGSNQLYIRKLSTIKLTVSASPVLSSTIVEYKFASNNNELTGTASSRDISLNQYELGIGAKKITVTVKDSRGRTASTDITVNILDYTPPELTAFSVERLSEPNATTIELKKAVKISSLKNGTTEKNLYTVVSRYKKTTDTAWVVAKNESNTSANFTLTGFAIDASYEFEVTITDKFNSVKVTGSVSTGVVFMDWYRDVGMGLGKMYEVGHGVLDLGGDLWIKGRNILNMFFPIGSIYQSVNSTDPSTFMGGTWVRFGRGKVLVGVDESDADFNTTNKEGGEKAHKLTVAEMASHSHKQLIGGSLTTTNAVAGEGIVGKTNNSQTDSVGGDQPHNNLQPYVTVYIWRRTA